MYVGEVLCGSQDWQNIRRVILIKILISVLTVINSIVRKRIWLCLKEQAHQTPHTSTHSVWRAWSSPHTLLSLRRTIRRSLRIAVLMMKTFFSFSRFKPLQCLDCDMTFPCFSELVSHQTIHDMEKPHKCKTCAKTFALDSELASHEKTHIREEPFKCTVCGKSFRVNMHLITHKRTHRRNTK